MKKIIFILVPLTFIFLTCNVKAYTVYKIGDEITYNDMDFYVIKNSGTKEEKLTLLKKTPLTLDEVNEYGVGHVNRYTGSSQGMAYNVNGYGGIAYYTSETCGYINDNWVSDGCTNNYDSSEIKYVVDAWKKAKASETIEARLITIDDLTDDMGMEFNAINPTQLQLVASEDSPMWIFGENYSYWTSSVNTDRTTYGWYVSNIIYSKLNSNYVSNHYYDIVVRPVIVLSKVILGDEDESIIDDNEEITIDAKDETATTVKVSNTYLRSSIIVIIIGFAIASISVFIVYKIVNNKVKK